METRRAIELLREDIALYETDVCKPGDGTPDGELMEALQTAISALEKQTPKKPFHTHVQSVDESGALTDGWYTNECPYCQEHLWVKYGIWDRMVLEGEPFCRRCGQKIDWDGDAP